MYRKAKGCVINSQRTAQALGHSLTPSWGLDGGGQSRAPMLSARAQAQKRSRFGKGLPGTPSPSQPASPACTGAAATGQKKLLPKPNPALWQGCPRAAQGGLASHEGHQQTHTEPELAGCEGHAPAGARLPASDSQHPQQLKKIITGNRETSVFQACTIKRHLINYI